MGDGKPKDSDQSASEPFFSTIDGSYLVHTFNFRGKSDSV